jgi:hypothetical protein
VNVPGGCITKAEYTLLLDEAYDFILFLEEMFDVKYRLADPDQIIVSNIKPEFWDKVVAPRLPKWVMRVVPHGKEIYVIPLDYLPYSVQVSLAGRLDMRGRKKT